MRDLTRQRSQLGGEQTAVANRVQKVLEDANIKLGSVATDVLGVSGRAMLEQWAAKPSNGRRHNVCRRQLEELNRAYVGMHI